MRYKILVMLFCAYWWWADFIKTYNPELEKTNTKIFYLLDYRIKNIDLNISETNKVLYIKDSILKRHRFYNSNSNTYDKVLCFAHLPPSIRLKSKVITYFHQYSFLSLPKESNIISRFKWFLKSKVLFAFKKNSDKWIVQSSHVKDKMIEKYDIESEKIDCIPFFSLKKVVKPVSKIKNKFVYVSFPYEYKNHLRLIEGFVESYKKNQKGELHLTVDNNSRYLIKKIEYYQKKNIPIFNHGIIKKAEVDKLYASSEYLVFPSTMESFGLPLIEAIYFECKVLASDLPFVNVICKPSFKFNPNDVGSISSAITKSINTNSKKSELIIKNQTSELIKLLTEG